MHGEYKTPGGKLVMVDLDKVDGRLRNVTVAGDFFLYPDDALEAITASLEGLDASLAERAVAEQVARAIAPGTELLGTSPEGIAIAVRRALETQGQEQAS
jgi:lipoate-protein ligase A